MNFLIPTAPSIEQYVRKKMQNYARIKLVQKTGVRKCLESEGKKIDPFKKKNPIILQLNLKVKNFGTEGPLPALPRPQHTTAGIVIRPVVRHSRGRRICHSPGTAIVWRGNERMQLKAILLNFDGIRQFSPVLKCNCVLHWLGAPLTNETYLSPFIIMSKTPQQFVEKALTNMLSLNRLIHKLPHPVITPQAIKTIFQFLKLTVH